MTNVSERPLVSMFVKTYNGRGYIDACLRSVFAQTYEPLDIVVSDDCSTDGTFERIVELVENYRRQSGKHQVRVNRNEKNLGIAMNCEKAIQLCRGELCVQSDGDDVHLPNRVERIVEAWIETGKKASVIWNGYHEIDEAGRFLGINLTFAHTEFPNPFGAMMTYRRDALIGFLPVNDTGYFDDAVFPLRARMWSAAEALVIDDALTLYRSL